MNQDIDENPIRWGVLATGAISRQFADALAILPDAELIAVGSRNIDSARGFAENYNVPYAYESYEQVVNDPNVDVVYIGTPHVLHKENVIMCLETGKAVLCEKPFTINAGEAEEIVTLARDKKLLTCLIAATALIMKQLKLWIA